MIFNNFQDDLEQQLNVSIGFEAGMPPLARAASQGNTKARSRSTLWGLTKLYKIECGVLLRGEYGVDHDREKDQKITGRFSRFNVYSILLVFGILRGSD